MGSDDSILRYKHLIVSLFPCLYRTLLQFAKKKRKRSDSGGSDLDAFEEEPPSSPKEDDGIEKRRSGRNTKRKKYTDDINLSDDESLLSQLPKDVVEEIKKDKAAKKKAAKEAIREIFEDPPEPEEGAPVPEETMDQAQSGPNYAFIVRMNVKYFG